jgi:hypothetical protein
MKPLNKPPLGYAFSDEPWGPRNGYALALLGQCGLHGWEERFVEISIDGGNTANCKWLRPVGVAGKYVRLASSRKEVK